MNDDAPGVIMVVLILLGAILTISTIHLYIKNENMDRFYACVKSDIESKRYSTMDSIECHCNTILKTEYGNTCK